MGKKLYLISIACRGISFIVLVIDLSEGVVLTIRFKELLVTLIIEQNHSMV